MLYTPTNWIDGETPVNGENLNKLEQAVQANSAAIHEIRSEETGVTSWEDLKEKPFGEEQVPVLEETRYDNFILDETYGAYGQEVNSAGYDLLLQQTYTVIWDGVSYLCSAQDISTLVSGGIGLGDLSGFGGSGNGEPFVVGWTPYGVVYFSFEAGTTHTVQILHNSVKTLDVKYLPMEAIDARIDACMDAGINKALGGDY